MRIKTGIVRHRKHKKILNLTKGSRMGNSNRIKLAIQTMLHAGEYAFAGRKLKKRDFRRLWIQRISAGLLNHNITYSQFIYGLKKANIELNRKMLADMALNYPEVFTKIVQKAK